MISKSYRKGVRTCRDRDSTQGKLWKWLVPVAHTLINYLFNAKLCLFQAHPEKVDARNQRAIECYKSARLKEPGPERARCSERVHQRQRIQQKALVLNSGELCKCQANLSHIQLPSRTNSVLPFTTGHSYFLVGWNGMWYTFFRIYDVRIYLISIFICN